MSAASRNSDAFGLKIRAQDAGTGRYALEPEGSLGCRGRRGTHPAACVSSSLGSQQRKGRRLFPSTSLPLMQAQLPELLLLQPSFVLASEGRRGGAKLITAGRTGVVGGGG